LDRARRLSCPNVSSRIGEGFLSVFGAWLRVTFKRLLRRHVSENQSFHARRPAVRELRRHFSGAVRAAADCYPLIPADEYRGPEPRQYTYEGREAAYQGRVFKVGRKIVFEASDPTVDEWRRLLRVLYADGGYFAHGVTYLEFLNERLSPKSENEKVAHANELAECGSGSMPRTQAEMRRLLEGDAPSTQAPTQQMDFAL
jgi:hypothetical protein